MASHSDDGNAAGSGGEAPHINPAAPLPPDLDPRGRSAARREQRAARGRRGDRGGTAAVAASGPARHDVRHGILVGVAIAATVASVAIVAASGWAWWTYKDFTSSIRRVNAIAPDKSTPDVDGKDQNILIVGNDDRDSATDTELKQLGTTRDGGSYNTDTMMVLHVPANGKKATVISFPRDSYVAIPGHGMNKLNSAYPDGILDSHGNKSAGARLLVQTIQNLTGLKIDHFVQVDLLGFYRISNAIGGVPVNLCQAQREPNSGINLPKGVTKIHGTQALAFVRQRYGLPGGDLDRIKRQQYFLSSAFRTISSAGVLLNPFKLQHLLKAVDQSLQMDKTLDPLMLAKQMQGLTAGNLVFKTIPTHGGESTDVGDVVVVNPSEVKQFAKRVIGATKGASSSGPFGDAKTVPPGSFTVDVLNGSNANHAATQSADLLRQTGFQVGRVDTTSTSAATVIEYPAGMQGQAKTLAAKIPGAHGRETNSVQHVTLVLGTDGLHVGSGSSHSAQPAQHASTSPAARSGMTAADTGACIN